MSFFKKKKDQSPVILEGEKGKSEQHSPYLDGRREWLERYGSYISRASNWRLVAFCALTIAGISISCNLIQATQIKTIPYIIEVDKLGKSAVVNRADRASAAPLRLIQADIAACITDWRTVTADVELQKQMISRLSYYFAGPAKVILKEWYSTNNPYEVAKSGKLVHVEIKSLPLPVSPETYRVEWLETVRTHSGITISQQAYEASVQIQINPPTSEAVLLHNPGGVYIVGISTSKVLNAQASEISQAQEKGKQ